MSRHAAYPNCVWVNSDIGTFGYPVGIAWYSGDGKNLALIIERLFCVDLRSLIHVPAQLRLLPNHFK
jgi:hypothetical protein